MSKTAKRLGRGLDSLISNLRGVQEHAPSMEMVAQLGGQTAAPAQEPIGKTSFHVEQAARKKPSQELVTMPVDVLNPNPYQPRASMNAEMLASLVRSIKKSGILQPITIRQRDGRNEIIAGERRWAAAKAAGLAEVPVIIRDADDEQMLELALIENIQRDDLNPIDRAKAYKRFCTRFTLSAEDLADRLGEDRSTVSNYMRILELSPQTQELLASGQLGMGHGRCLLGIADQRRRDELARRAVDSQWSVRTLEQMVRAAKDHPAVQPEHKKGKLAAFSPHVRDLQQRFEQTLKTKVSIQEGRRKGSGRIVIEYYSLDDFDRIATALGVESD